MVATVTSRVDLRSTTEFARDEDGGRFQQTLQLQTLQQAGQTAVERRGLLLQLSPVVVVSVPATQFDGDEPRTGFDQP